MNPTINATFIIEILGRPIEYLKSTLESLIDQLEKEKGVRVIERIVHEPKKIEEKKIPEEEKKIVDKLKNRGEIIITNEIFTTFAEIEAEFETLESLLQVTFSYMPSHIEITNPENFILKNSDISGLLTGIIIKLHKYDELAKKLSLDKAILEEKIKEIVSGLKNKNNK